MFSGTVLVISVGFVSWKIEQYKYGDKAYLCILIVFLLFLGVLQRYLKSHPEYLKKIQAD